MTTASIDQLTPPHAAIGRSQPPATDSVPATISPPDAQTIAGRKTAVGSDHGGLLEPPPGDDVSLDFVDADIATVARSVLVDTLHLTATIDPRVSGKVTLQTSAPIKRTVVLALLEDAFRMNGAAIVEIDGRIDVVPADAAKFSMGTARVGTARGPGWRTQIVPLRFANAVEVEKSIEAITPIGASVHADPGSNSLILTGSGTEIANLMDTIGAFDTDVMAGKSFGLWPLQVADAGELATDLTNIFATSTTGDTNGGVRFLPIRRINAILGIARDVESLYQAKKWVDRLDKAGDSNETQLFVYRVNAGRAGTLVDLLAKLYPDDFVDKVGTERNSANLGAAQQAAGAAGNALGATSSGGSLAATTGQSGDLSTATGSRPTGPSSLSSLGFNGASGAQQSAPQRQGVSLSPIPGETTQQRTGGARIIADVANNVILIQARPAQYRRIENSLQKLDVMPAQVSIEATILEVTLTDELSLGVQSFLTSGKSGFKLAPNSSGAIGAIAPGFSYVWPVNGPKLVVDALRDVTEVDVVSSPTLMVMDNETAQLQVGDQVPIITSTSQSTLVSGSPVINNVEYHDTGVILAVTPRITLGGTVLLDIQQEVSDVTTTTSSDIDSPTFEQRRFHSTVAVADGDTLMLGGLISTQKNRGHTGVPYLSEIPVLGAAFDNRTDTNDRTELMVMITPHIVRNQAEAKAAADEIRRRIQDTVSAPPRVLP
jgi:general secretion pathway protein D